MPTYEYECGTCGTFEQFQRITEDPLSDCPRCGSAVRRLISSGTGIIFKGSGFYSTDSRDSGKNEAGKNEAGKSGDGAKSKESNGDGAGSGKDTSGKDSSGSDGKTGSKAETKTDTGAKKKEPAAATAAKD